MGLLLLLVPLTCALKLQNARDTGDTFFDNAVNPVGLDKAETMCEHGYTKGGHHCHHGNGGAAKEVAAGAAPAGAAPAEGAVNKDVAAAGAVNKDAAGAAPAEKAAKADSAPAPKCEQIESWTYSGTVASRCELIDQCAKIGFAGLNKADWCGICDSHNGEWKKSCAAAEAAEAAGAAGAAVAVKPAQQPPAPPAQQPLAPAPGFQASGNFQPPAQQPPAPAAAAPQAPGAPPYQAPAPQTGGYAVSIYGAIPSSSQIMDPQYRQNAYGKANQVYENAGGAAVDKFQGGVQAVNNGLGKAAETGTYYKNSAMGYGQAKGEQVYYDVVGSQAGQAAAAAKAYLWG